MQNSLIVSRVRSLHQQIPESWRFSLVAWLIPKCGLTLIGLLLYWTNLLPAHPDLKYYYGVTPLVDGINSGLLGIWQRWDALYYIRIVQTGYNSVDLSAFFPIYPLLARIISITTGIDALNSLLLVSNVSLILSLVVLYDLTRDLFTANIAKTALWCVVLFPSAFFLYAPYPQSTSLLFVLSAYRFMRKKKWLGAMIFGFLAGLTHATIIPLAILLGIESLKQILKRFDVHSWFSLAAPVGPILGIAFFLAWRVSQGYPSLVDLQVENWGRLTQWPWLTLLDFPKWFQYRFFYISGWLNLCMILVSVVVIFWGFHHLPKSIWLYEIALLLFLLSSTGQFEPVYGFNRLALLMFPTTIALASWLQGRFRRFLGIIFGSGLQIYFASLFFLWIWVG